MIFFRNFILGAAVAAICLAPAAWADAGRLLSGRSLAPVLATAAGGIGSPIGHPATGGQGMLPQLIVGAFAHLLATRPEHD
jgi:hypothetical protein